MRQVEMKGPESIVASQSKLGEGPLWSTTEQALYWVDIHRQRVERYHPASGQHKVYQFDLAVTALGLRERGGFVAATARGLGVMQLSESTLKILAHPEADKPHNRFNDGAVDPQGRFWAGTMYEGPETKEPAEGCLYRLDIDSSVHVMQPGLTISNGLGWSPDVKTMYLTDTLRRLIYAYDYDAKSGAIENRRVFIDSSQEAGYPDGLTVDSEGCIWSCRWSGWRVTRYDPAGKAEREIKLPVECPTSCAFGGSELHDLYITTAWTALSEEQRKDQPMSGDVFCLHTAVQGRAPWQFAG
jgi:sugar lactone lactonase YvrE